MFEEIRTTQKKYNYKKENNYFNKQFYFFLVE